MLRRGQCGRQGRPEEGASLSEGQAWAPVEEASKPRVHFRGEGACPCHAPWAAALVREHLVTTPSSSGWASGGRWAVTLQPIGDPGPLGAWEASGSQRLGGGGLGAPGGSPGEAHTLHLAIGWDQSCISPRTWT